MKDFYKLIKSERKKTLKIVNQSMQNNKEKSFSTTKSFFGKIKSYFSFEISNSNRNIPNIDKESIENNNSFV